MNSFFLRAAAASLLVASLPSLGLGQTAPGKAAAASPAPSPQLPATASTAPAPVGWTPFEVKRTRELVRNVQTNTENIKTKGDLGAQLWLVDGLQFFEDWRKPATPNLDPVEIAPRGQNIYTAIIFYGMARDPAGLSNVNYDITVHRPDGSVYSQQKDMIGWQALTPPDARSLELGHDRLAINIGATDPAGLYSVEVLLHDNIGHVDLPLKQTFVVQ